MKKVVATAFVTLLLSCTAFSQTLTPLSINFDRDFKLIMAYPLEVKYGSRVRVILDLTALRDALVNTLYVKFVLVHEGGSVTLFEGTLLKFKAFTQGEQYHTSIDFQAAIPAPQPPRDPFVELTMKMNYTVGTTEKFYEYRASISLVPRLTYTELTDQLARAQEKAKLADALAAELSNIRLKLANESGRASALSGVVNELMAENKALSNRIGMLESENSALKAELESLRKELETLRSENAALREERSGLFSRLTNIEDLYSLATKELASLKKEYDKVLAESNNLKIGLAITLTAFAATLIAVILRRKGFGSGKRLPPPPPPSSMNRTPSFAVGSV